MIDVNDIFFLQTQFSKLTDSQRIELPVDYIERVRSLPKELTSMPGKYNYDKGPFLKEMVNHLHPSSDARKIVFMKPAQIFATTGILESGIAFNIGCDPKPQLFVSADRELVKIGMETKVERLLDTCKLREKIFSQTAGKTKKTGDTAMQKEYPGGFLHAIGARNPGKLRQMSYPVIWFDELDGFPATVGKEGSPIDLAEKRTKGYAETRKIFYMSTPTLTQTSQINELYLLGDQRNWFMPCIHCGEMQVYRWRGVNTDTGLIYGIKFEISEGLPVYETVTYQCMYCGKHMKNYDKVAILEAGEWRPTAKSQEPGLYSYWINSLVSPPGMYSWENMVVEWSKCWDLEKNRVKNIDKLQVFYNTDRGLPFKEQGKQIRSEKVQQYKNHKYLKNEIKNIQIQIDSGGIIQLITCAIDVQKDNVFVDVKGWCKGCISYTLDFFSIEGNTESIDGDVWKKLEDYIKNERWVDEIGREYFVGIAVIDSNWNSDNVYKFVKKFSDNVYAIRGVESFKGGLQPTFKVFSKQALKDAGLNLAYNANTTKLKDRISNIFNLQWETETIQPDYYPNFPDDFRDDYFRHFEAEHKIIDKDAVTNRFIRSRWVHIKGRENHAFDTFVYSLAAIEILMESICIGHLGLEKPSWSKFWEDTENDPYYKVLQK